MVFPSKNTFTFTLNFIIKEKQQSYKKAFVQVFSVLKKLFCKCVPNKFQKIYLSSPIANIGIFLAFRNVNVFFKHSLFFRVQSAPQNNSKSWRKSFVQTTDLEEISTRKKICRWERVFKSWDRDRWWVGGRVVVVEVTSRGQGYVGQFEMPRYVYAINFKFMVK